MECKCGKQGIICENGTWICLKCIEERNEKFTNVICNKCGRITWIDNEVYIDVLETYDNTDKINYDNFLCDYCYSKPL